MYIRQSTTSQTGAETNMDKYTSCELLARLVAFDTTSWKSNLDLIRFVQRYLAGYGVPSRLLFNEAQNKANLFATLGPADQGGIILSGHTDVVPVTGQDWTTPPFELTKRGGRLYGRGSSDMKGFIACCLAAVPDFLRRGLKEPVHLAFSYDEEVGCTGVSSLLDMIRDMSPRPRACIVGEPTDMKVVNAHKGIRYMKTRIQGREAHSSTDRGLNSIYYAAELISYLNRLREEMKTRPAPSEGFDPPYTTVQVGTIRGGEAANITPAHCEFEWEYRPVPGSDPDEILTRFQEFVEDEILPKMRAEGGTPEAVQTEQIANVLPLLPETGSPAESLVLALAEQNSVSAVSYGTEAGAFQKTAAVPTVVCGPGSILQAHRPDEYIDQAQLDACDAFLKRLQDVVCEKSSD